MTLLKVATDLRALFDSEKSWTKGALARNVAGDSVSTKDPEATSWCLYGGLLKVTNDDVIVQKQIACRFLQKRSGKIPVTGFNDRGTFGAVIHACDEFVKFAKDNEDKDPNELLKSLES